MPRKGLPRAGPGARGKPEGACSRPGLEQMSVVGFFSPPHFDQGSSGSEPFVLGEREALLRRVGGEELLVPST